MPPVEHISGDSVTSGYETHPKKLRRMGRSRRKISRMTKAWESKSVESQVQDSQGKKHGKRGSKLSPLQIDARRKREVLILSRSRVQRDLQASQDQRYRELLTRALADLEAQINALEETLGGNS